MIRPLIAIRAAVNAMCAANPVIADKRHDETYLLNEYTVLVTLRRKPVIIEGQWRDTRHDEVDIFDLIGEFDGK